MKEISFYRIPILTKDEKIFGYEILSEIESLEEIFIDLIEKLDLEEISEGKFILLRCNKKILKEKILEVLDFKNIIIEITLNDLDEEMKNCLKINGQKVSKIVLFLSKEDFDNLEKDILDYVDIISTNYENFELLKNISKKKLIKNVNKREEFEKVKNYADYFEGFFFEEPKIIKDKTLSPYETTLITLINKLSNPDVEISEIEKIIKSDINLTINFLKFVNSPIFGLVKEITSIRQALTILGIKKLQKWLVLLLLAKDKSSLDTPLFSMVLIRSKILEELAKYLLEKKKVKDPDFPEKAYLVGLLSLIDSILGISKEKYLDKLRISKEIKEAVLEKEGFLGELLKLTKEIERGNMFSLKPKIEKIGIPIDKALAIRFQAYKYAREIIKSFS